MTSATKGTLRELTARSGADGKVRGEAGHGDHTVEREERLDAPQLSQSPAGESHLRNRQPDEIERKWTALPGRGEGEAAALETRGGERRRTKAGGRRRGTEWGGGRPPCGEHRPGDRPTPSHFEKQRRRGSGDCWLLGFRGIFWRARRL